MIRNISISRKPEKRIAAILAKIGKPALVQILLILAQGESCVCHLEAVLGGRQARISQHLMDLRKAGLVKTRRNGRNIYYRLVNEDVILVIEAASQFLDIDIEKLRSEYVKPFPNCKCSECFVPPENSET